MLYIILLTALTTILYFMISYGNNGLYKIDGYFTWNYDFDILFDILDKTKSKSDNFENAYFKNINKKNRISLIFPKNSINNSKKLKLILNDTEISKFVIKKKLKNYDVIINFDKEYSNFLKYSVIVKDSYNLYKFYFEKNFSNTAWLEYLFIIFLLVIFTYLSTVDKFYVNLQYIYLFVNFIFPYLKKIDIFLILMILKIIYFIFITVCLIWKLYDLSSKKKTFYFEFNNMFKNILFMVNLFFIFFLYNYSIILKPFILINVILMIELLIYYILYFLIILNHIYLNDIDKKNK